MTDASLLARLGEPDLAGLPDWRVAARLNAPDPALPRKRVDLATHEVRGLLLTTGEWPRIVMTAEGVGGPPEALRALCVLMRDTLLHTETIETSKPARHGAAAAALAALSEAGLIAGATRDALLELAERPQSWAEAQGTEVTATTVGLARGAIG